jgi:tRNA(Ile)-lysidine synthase
VLCLDGMQTTDLIPVLKKELAPYRHKKRWVIAYSGGVDSSVLVHAVHHITKTVPINIQIVLLHINHNLQTAAKSWEEHCQKNAQQAGIPIVVEHVHVSCDKNISLETEAREARYFVFSQHLKKDDILLMAHHADDQLETFIMRWVRSAGLKGLLSIPKMRSLSQGHIVRPLLSVSKQDILSYAEQYGIDYVEDSSNFSLVHDRNFLRHNVMPHFFHRWPNIRERVNKTLSYLAEVQSLVDEYARDDLERFLKEDRWCCFYFDLSEIQILSTARYKHLMKYTCSKVLNITLSASILNQLVEDDFKRVEFSHRYLIQKFNNRLYFCYLDSMQNESKVLCNGHTLKMKVGSLKFSCDHHQTIVVKFRAGGERSQPKGRQSSQRLKKLMQEAKVPPWWRDRVPLLYDQDETLLAVGDLWLEKDTADCFTVEWCLDSNKPSKLSES